MTRIWVAAILLALLGGASQPARAGSIGFKVGVGYDFLSQEYFLDSLTQAGVDSFLTNWSLRTNYLDDFRARTELRFTPPRAGGLDLRAIYEQGSEQLRFKLNPVWRPTFGKYRLETRGDLDWRDQYRGETDPGDSYVSASGQAKLKRRYGESLSLWIAGQGELVRFADPGSFAYNYQRIGGRLGADLFAGLGMGSADLFYLGRRVPDSSELQYHSYGAEVSWFGLSDWGDLDLQTRLERKDYQRPDGSDDYTRLELNGRSRISLGKGWFAKPDIELERTWYGPEDLINQDYTKITGAAALGKSLGGLELGIGPEIERLATADDSLSGEAYLELGGEGTLDWLQTGKLFSTLDYHLGYRELDQPSDLQSSFTYQRVNLIGDWNVLGGLNLDIVLGLEWEWHSRSEDNSRLVLLSTGLTYSF